MYMQAILKFHTNSTNAVDLGLFVNLSSILTLPSWPITEFHVPC